MARIEERGSDSLGGRPGKADPGRGSGETAELDHLRTPQPRKWAPPGSAFNLEVTGALEKAPQLGQ